MKGKRTIEKLKLDKRVADAWDEHFSRDGYWVTLKPGFADMGFDPCQPTHTIHEWTVKRILHRMRDVKPCSCNECRYSKK